MLDGRPVRFGYSPQEFPGFSWRGYAQMSPIQVGTRPLNLATGNSANFNSVQTGDVETPSAHSCSCV